MATKLVIRGGTAEGVYDDDLSAIYSALGVPTVERASTVEARTTREGTILWIAKDLNGNLIAANRDRRAAIATEVKVLESRIK